MPSRSSQADRDDAGSAAEPKGLGEILDRVEACTHQRSQVSIEDVMDAAGRRAFAPLILIPGLVMLAPGVGDIPGVPVLMGLIVILTVVQMLMRRQSIWLPRWLRRRSVRATLVRKTVSWLRGPARFADRWSRPRLTWAVHHAGFAVTAMACLAVAMATPAMELVPFSANLAGAVITAFGLALITEDGLVALVAVGLAVGAGVLLGFQLT